MKKIDILLSWIIAAFLSITIILLLIEIETYFTDVILIFIALFNFILLIINTFFRKMRK